VGESGATFLDVGVNWMFMGEYYHTIDSKGRLIVPAKLRDSLGDGFIITKGLDQCLFAYPHEEWSNIEQKMRNLPFTQKDARAFMRFFFSGAVDCEIDKQGRILIPPTLREYAALEKETVIIGVSTRVEIWSKAKWEEYSSNAQISYEEIAEKMVELGI
jgi:MraZ protein